jgi:DNA-binding beta-propeller fold protein YncE
VSTLAGTGEEGFQDGEGTVAQFNEPYGVAVDGGGNVIVADFCNHRIRNITPQGQVSTLAKTDKHGHRDGDRFASAQFYPSGVAVDEYGHIIVVEMESLHPPRGR